MNRGEGDTRWSLAPKLLGGTPPVNEATKASGSRQGPIPIRRSQPWAWGAQCRYPMLLASRLLGLLGSALGCPGDWVAFFFWPGGGFFWVGSGSGSFRPTCQYVLRWRDAKAVPASYCHHHHHQPPLPQLPLPASRLGHLRLRQEARKHVGCSAGYRMGRRAHNT